MMSDLPFDFDPTRTAFSDGTYAAIGRGLSLATRFEANCRALATLIGFREALKIRQPGDEESVDDLFTRLAQEYWQVRRLRHHETTIALYEKLPQDVRAILRDGRRARNDFAHEMALGLERDIETDEGRSSVLRSLRDAVAAIAVADRAVCVLAHLESREPLPTASALDAYADRMIEWVCDVE